MHSIVGSPGQVSPAGPRTELGFFRVGGAWLPCGAGPLDSGLNAMPIPKRRRFGFALPRLLLAAAVLSTPGVGSHAARPELVLDESLGLRVARGFSIRQVAGPGLANDIQAMTLDSLGRPVVTGPGYIRTLHDDDGDGIHDRATLFAEPPAGGMGLFVDGKALWFCGGGALSVYTDADGDGRADGPPRVVLAVSQGEHGGHAMRKGPDGWWHFAGGNDARLDWRAPLFAGRRRPPIEAGVMLRIAPGGAVAEVFADGFRNHYDFDFNWRGDLLTYDSDVERDYPLPWYTPTRAFTVEEGGHHGWRMEGYLRSWDRPGHYPEAVPPVARLGRGSPTGVVNYRHTQFPAAWRDGTFLADWTFGRIHFLPDAPAGSEVAPELFLEAAGSNGFAPTDLEVTPAGELLVSIGGRGTRGGLFSIRWSGGDVPGADGSKGGAMERALKAPQPLSAWSRAVWEPLAQKLGVEAFERVVGDPASGEREAARSLEILTDQFGGVSDECAEKAAGHPSAVVRRRAAWALARRTRPPASAVWQRLAADPDASVRAEWLRGADRWGPARLDWVAGLMAGQEGSVRRAALALAGRMSPGQLAELKSRLAPARAQGMLTWLLAAAPRGLESADALAWQALALAGQLNSEEGRLGLCRALAVCLGDWNLRQPSVEIYTGYEGANPRAVAWETRRAMAEWAAGAFPTGSRLLDLELARLLAMVAADDPKAVEAVAGKLGPGSDPTDDFHHLVCLSRMGGTWPEAVAARVAATFVGLSAKLEGRERRQKQNWSARLAECLAEVSRRHPEVERMILADPRFTAPGQRPLLEGLSVNGRRLAAARHWELLRDARPEAWTVETLRLVDAHAPPDWPGRLRRLARHRPLREEALAALGRTGSVVAADLDLIRQVVAQGSLAERQWAVAAWRRLGGPDSSSDIASLILLHRRLLGDLPARGLRQEVRDLLRERPGPESIEGGDGMAAQTAMEAGFLARHPSQASLLAGDDAAAAVLRLVDGVADWSGGDAALGGALFAARACTTCHDGGNSIGPDLKGVGRRLSPKDLFRAIALPDLDVAPPYRVSQFSLANGSLVEGMTVFFSADGWMVRVADGTTVRLDSAEVVEVVQSAKSLMPQGLLDGLEEQDLRHLAAWLRSGGD